MIQETLLLPGQVERMAWPEHDTIQHSLGLARPRLSRLARLMGVPNDNVEDVVQETLLRAWQYRGQVQSHERFDAWLDTICRNACRRHYRSHQGDERYLAELPPVESADRLDEIPDPSAFDPEEELARHDLETLLDRALGHLPVTARESLTLCYLAEIPQREVALRLGITITALEARLHRARRQLRDVLAGELRAEAQTFGLFLDTTDEAIWHPSRIWCHSCGRHFLEGRFYRASNGNNALTMRCPACAPNNMGFINTGESEWLAGIKTFVPAMKRLWKFGSRTLLEGVRGKMSPCFFCAMPLTFRVLSASELGVLPTMPSQMLVSYTCLRCHITDWSDAILTMMNLPILRQFCDEHPRAVMTEPDQVIEYAGQRAIRSHITDLMSTARLTIIARHDTLDVLETIVS